MRGSPHIWLGTAAFNFKKSLENVYSSKVKAFKMEWNYTELNGDYNYEQLQIVINNKQWEEAEETYLAIPSRTLEMSYFK